jgi:hypothetical protein
MQTTPRRLHGLAGRTNMWDTPEAMALKAGQSTSLVIGGVTVTFPSGRFCLSYVDDNFLNHVSDIVNYGRNSYGNGAVNIDRTNNCGHKKLTGGDAIGYKWSSDTDLAIVGYGEKSSKGSKRQGSGGYEWET